MKIKKLLAVILSVIILIIQLVIPVYAEDIQNSVNTSDLFSLKLQLETDTAISSNPMIINPGEEVTLKISVEQNTGISFLRFITIFDEEVFEYLGYESKNLFDSSEYFHIYEGHLIYFFDNENKTDNKTDIGDLFTITFKTKESFCGDAQIVTKLANDDISNCCKASDSNIYYVVPVTFEANTVNTAIHSIKKDGGVVIEPTCVDNGYTIHKCTTCEKDVVGNIVEKSAHNFVNGVCTDCKVISEEMLTYTVSNGEATITDCNTSISGDVVIPSTLGGYPVTSIGNCAFEYCYYLTSVVIPDGVTSIGGNVFLCCSSLTSITIPDSITSIKFGGFLEDWEDYPFGAIDRVNITDLAAWCKIDFGRSYYVVPYTNPANPLCYAGELYINGILATDIIIPDTVTSISDCAFYGYNLLTSVTIPKNVTSIGNYVFSRCNLLESIEIHNPDCKISQGTYDINDVVTIYGYKNSTAEEFAINSNYEFIPFEPKIDGVSISAGTDITVNYYCEYGAQSDMRFTMNGKETIVKGVYDSASGKFVYKFTGVTPERIADEIKAELITDGEVVAVKEGFNVKKYLDTVLSKTNTDFGMSEAKFQKLKTLACDLLNYSAAAQKYFGYKTDSLVNSGVTGGTVFTAPTKTDKDITNASKNGVSFTGQNLYFDSTNKLMFRFKVDTSVITDITKLEIKISNGDEIKTVGYKDFEALGNNTYIVYTDDIYATEFDSVFTATACYNGVDGANVKYSVNSYIYAMCNKANVSNTMLELAKATYNYGLSAKEYAKAK